MRLLLAGNNPQLSQAIALCADYFGAEIYELRNAPNDIDPQQLEIFIKQVDAQIVINSVCLDKYLGNANGDTNDGAGNDSDIEYIVANSANIAKACANIGLPLIHISPCSAYDVMVKMPYTEISDILPSTKTGNILLRSEDAIIDNCNYSVILRTSWCYDENNHDWLKAVFDGSFNNPELDIDDVDADYFGNPTSYHDLAIGIMEITRNLLADYEIKIEKRELCGVFNIANSGNVSLRRFANYINTYLNQGDDGDIFNTKPNTEQKELKSRELSKNPIVNFNHNAMLDCDKLLQIHGVHLLDWRIALQKILKNIKDNNSKI